MNNILKKFLALGVVAWGVTVAGAAEKVWNFDSIQNVAPPLWEKTAAPGFVSDSEGIACVDGNLVFTVKEPHCYFWLNFAQTVEEMVLDAKQYHLLTIRFYSPVSGKITLFYSSPDGEMASMDRAIDVAEGWNEYEVDLKTMTFGREVHSKLEGEGKKYQRWGGELEQVSGLRIDPWFPKGTTVKFDYIKLSDDKADKK